ncbi:B9 domain-containing protein 1 [Halocaridina rubra]|uniref:B9 domain-containing protein 1 n=1 Tax=Halocaridina rubra TaxID=373956 RepID=A0AAN8XIT3_HALRR
MSLSLLEKLSEYCDKLVGDNHESSSGKQSSINKAKKRKKDQRFAKHESVEKTNKKTEYNDREYGTDKETENITANSKMSLTELKHPAENTYTISTTTENKTVVTDDGFKIVSSIPKDDSDVSDAFVSDENCNPSEISGDFETGCKGFKTTDDGFRITSYIPPDDSDISDAFSDGEDSDGTGEELILKRKELTSEKNITKPILQMIDDFGLDGSIFEHRPSVVSSGRTSEDTAQKTICAVRKTDKKKKKRKLPINSSTLASTTKPKVDVTVYDYSSQRGRLEQAAIDGESTSTLSRLTKEDIEKQIKSMRFDIYKLGMTGFNKRKKKETRAALAIKLGAVPNKKGGMKYNELLRIRKKEKTREVFERERNKEMGIENKKKPNKNSKGKKKPRAFSSQVGKFKDGVLSLSRKDLAKIKKT